MRSVLIFGKPNSGKTLLFNRLTGLRQKVANFPGVTVEIKTGMGPDGISFTDHPGVYSFHAMTEDETVALKKYEEALSKESVGLVLGVLDATRLERSLSLGLEAKSRANRAGKKFIFALNMMDEIELNQTSVDVEGLATSVGCPVIPISARTEKGLDHLRNVLKAAMDESSLIAIDTSEFAESHWGAQAKKLQQEFGAHSELLLKNQNRLDRVFLSSVGGGLLFLAIMAMVFQSIFTWAVPLMDLTEEIINQMGVIAVGLVPQGMISDFVNDALFGGFGSFLVFVPQIFILTLIIGILEDSGYLARAAIICHRPLSVFGLSGKSFLPLLTGHACAIPAIFAARTVESPRKRLLTMIAIPMMSCSARLPVYSLLIAALIPSVSYLGGLVGLQGLTFLGLYIFSLVMGLLVSAVVSRVKYKNESAEPFVLELPPYRLPHWKPLFHRSIYASVSFVRKAGPVIFVVTVGIWFLGYFPEGAGRLDESYLAILGRAIEPVFATIGLDWMMGVAILTSFLAREVFVGTLGTLFGIEGADENVAGLASQLQTSGLSLASGMALLVFFAISLQCVSTLAVIRKESGSFKLPTAMFIGYTLLACALAYLTYLVIPN